MNTLIIKNNLLATINHLHKKIGKTEWSGILFYTKDNDVEDIKNLKLTAHYLKLMNIGSSSFTNFEYGETILDMFDKYPETENMRIGIVHTHHNMPAFFSSVDTEELNKNAKNHEIYLSLIVNFDSNWCAKVAIGGTAKTKVTFRNGYISDVTVDEVISENVNIQYEKIDIDDKEIEDLKPKFPKHNGYNGNYNSYPNPYHSSQVNPINKIPKVFQKEKLEEQYTDYDDGMYHLSEIFKEVFSLIISENKEKDIDISYKKFNTLINKPAFNFMLTKQLIKDYGLIPEDADIFKETILELFDNKDDILIKRVNIIYNILKNG